jgi:hypothetical protein
MMSEYEIKRYAAYYKGWCQTFGEHESVLSDDGGISWLFSEQQIGFISPQKLTRSLLLEVLRKNKTPTLTIGHHSVHIGKIDYGFSKASDESALEAVKNLLEGGEETHLFLTSHFMYGMGARILTLSHKKPAAIIYKEIGAMRIRLR